MNYDINLNRVILAIDKNIELLNIIIDQVDSIDTNDRNSINTTLTRIDVLATAVITNLTIMHETIDRPKTRLISSA